MKAADHTEPARLMIIPGNAQHQGNRTDQQDSFGFSDATDPQLVERCGVLAVIADGMGGHALGLEAGRLAVSTLLAEYPQKSPEEPVLDALLRLIHRANEAVCSLGREHGQEDNLGTTVTAAVVYRDYLYWAAVGDSHLYLLRNGNLVLMSEDHVYARELDRGVIQGQLSREQADSHPQRNSLTSFLGLNPLVDIDCNRRNPYPLQVGDRLLLCSDGLYRVLDEREISEELTRKDPQEAAEALLARALAKNDPGQDNVTVMVMACADPAAPRPVSHSAPRRGRFRIGLLLGACLLAALGALGWFLLRQAG